MINIIRNIIIAGAIMNPAQAQIDIEQPAYEIIKESDGVELRSYASHIVAQVQVKARSRNEASSKGFRPLAGYIFGNNNDAGQISMTAPVTTQSAPTAIAMTAQPVTTQEINSSGAENGEYIVRFSMPSKWTMETLPIPNDDNVKLVKIAPQMLIAYRFVGQRSQERIDSATNKMDAFLTAEGLTAASPAIIAGYDGPSVPIDRKRWEIMRVVAKPQPS